MSQPIPHRNLIRNSILWLIRRYYAWRISRVQRRNADLKVEVRSARRTVRILRKRKAHS